MSSQQLNGTPRVEGARRDRVPEFRVDLFAHSPTGPLLLRDDITLLTPDSALFKAVVHQRRGAQAPESRSVYSLDSDGHVRWTAARNKILDKIERAYESAVPKMLRQIKDHLADLDLDVQRAVLSNLRLARSNEPRFQISPERIVQKGSELSPFERAVSSVVNFLMEKEAECHRRLKAVMPMIDRIEGDAAQLVARAASKFEFDPARFIVGAKPSRNYCVAEIEDTIGLGPGTAKYHGSGINITLMAGTDKAEITRYRRALPHIVHHEVAERWCDENGRLKAGSIDRPCSPVEAHRKQADEAFIDGVAFGAGGRNTRALLETFALAAARIEVELERQVRRNVEQPQKGYFAFLFSAAAMCDRWLGTLEWLHSAGELRSGERAAAVLSRKLLALQKTTDGLGVVRDPRDREICRAVFGDGVAVGGERVAQS